MVEITINDQGESVTLAIYEGTQGPQGPPGEADQRIGGILLSNPAAASVTTGDSKALIRIPVELNGMVLSSVAACCATAGSSGPTTIQLRRVRAGVSVDMLSTRITIDANEVDSSTATAAVINASNDDVQTGDQVHFDLDAVSTGTAGIFVSFTFDN